MPDNEERIPEITEKIKAGGYFQKQHSNRLVGAVILIICIIIIVPIVAVYGGWALALGRQSANDRKIEKIFYDEMSAFT